MTDLSPDAPEITLAETKSTLPRGGLKSKIGRVVLTSDRIVFFDEKWNSSIGFGVGGPIAGRIAEALQQRHEAGGPLLELPLAEVAAVERARKGFDRNVLLVRTASGEEHRFLGLFGEWSPLLRRAVTERHGRAVRPSGEGWTVA